MYLTITWDGVPIGATELDGWGVRAGRFAPLPSYAAFGLSRPARRLGIAFLATHWARVPAASARRAWQAAADAMSALEIHFGLLDASGATVRSPRIGLVELPRRSPMAGTYVIADLGESGAGRGARRPLRPTPGTDASRPAA